MFEELDPYSGEWTQAAPRPVLDPAFAAGRAFHPDPDVPPDDFLTFANLDGVDSMEEFLSRYGWLHGPKPPYRLTPKRPRAGVEPARVEPVEVWETAVARMRSLVRLWVAVSRKDCDRLSEYLEWREGLDTGWWFRRPGGADSYVPDDTGGEFNILAGGRAALANELAEWGQELARLTAGAGGLSLTPVVSQDGYDFRPQGGPLLPGLLAQFVRALVLGLGCVDCARCRRFQLLGRGKKGRRKHAVFCSVACRVAAHRDRRNAQYERRAVRKSGAPPKRRK